MSKILKEDCRTISIYDLKRWGCLIGYYSGMINWTSGWSEKKSSVSFSVDLASFGNEKCFELDYTITDNFSGEKHKINQKYPILTTSCNYGGVRYWFECSVYNQGVYCGRKVAKLYLGSGSHYFACRHCYDLSYRSKIDGYAFTYPDIEEYEKNMKRWYYRGKPTIKHKRLLKMIDKNNRDMMRLIPRLKSLSRLLARK